MSHGYIDISYTSVSNKSNNNLSYIDPVTVEVLFLNEVVDNPSNTTCEYKYHRVPVLGILPAAFSSNGTVLTGAEVCETLLVEHFAHSGNDDPSEHFPPGADAYISAILSDVISYVLYEYEPVYTKYTSGMIRSVYGWNYIFGILEAHRFRERAIKLREDSLIHSIPACVEALEKLLEHLSSSVHLCSSMHLPLRITSKLFSLVSVLLAVPLPDDELSNFIKTSPPMIALANWGENVNKGCKLWPVWPSQPENPELPKISVPRKNGPHNVLFLMSSCAVLFVYLATNSNV